MKILTFEYITGGGMADADPPASLVAEGERMLGSLVCDLRGVTGVETFVLYDARLPEPGWAPAGTTLFPVASATPFAEVWERALQAVDAVWPIAPESGGILADLCAAIPAGGKLLLNSPAEAVRLAASKRDTAERLHAAGIAAVPTYRFGETPADCPWPRVVKPDDGVGCEDARVLGGPADWDRWHAGHAGGEWIVQPYLAGEAMSLSALFCRGEGRLLTVNRQHIVQEDSRFVLRGCRVGVENRAGNGYRELIERIARAVPDLWGYAGVDFILTEQGPAVLEINPRLTTSWAGLHGALGVNPAALVLELARGRPLASFAIPDMQRPVEVAL